MTLLEVRTAVRQRADMLEADGVYTTSFITDSELNSYINQSYFELYDLLVQKYGDDYYAVMPPLTFITDGTTQFYPLPADFYKLLAVDVLVQGGTNNAFYSLKSFTMGERNLYPVPNYQSFYGISNLKYRLIKDKLWLNPIPAAGQTVRMIYVPTMTTLSADSDTVNGISGWTEYIITDAAIKCLQKEESDVSVLAAQKMALIKRIESAAENRDAINPATISDVQTNDAPFGWRV